MTYLEMKKQIKDKLSTQMDFEDSQNLLEVGLNSLQVVRLVNQWRKQGIRVSFGGLMENPTIAEWWQIVQKGIQKGKDKANKKVVKPSVVLNTPFPLTDVQYAYWIGRNDDQTLGGCGCHAYLEFEGKQVDADKLNRAWNTLQYHHPMLRAKFLPNGTQIIMKKPYSEDIPVNDLRNLTGEDLDRELKSIRDSLSHRKLKVEEGQVAGVILTLLPNEMTRVHVDMDLMIADVQSLQILLRDLVTAYEEKKLPESSKDWSFASYLREEIEEEKIEFENAKKYWKERLETLPVGPELPLAKRPEEIKTTKFSRRIIRIGEKEWDNLKKQAAAYKTTPATMLLTAYALILERWSVTKRFLINIPLFNRKTEKKGLEEAIADFTTLLLLEVDCRNKLTFINLLETIQKQFHRDIKNAIYSGIQLQRDLSQKHGGNHNAAPVVFACNLGIPLINESFKEHIGKFYYMISQTPQVWLDFQTYESEEELMLTWDTVDELFPEKMIEDMFTSFEKLLKRLGHEDWDQVFDLLPENQLNFLENKLNIGKLENPQCLHTAFLEQIKKNPNNIAVIDASKNISLTYEELANSAKSVASAIVNKGIYGESIAITLPRGYEQIVAALGVLISGNYYVPVSLEQPKDRRELIHEKTDIHYVITDGKNENKIEGLSNTEIWKLEKLQEETQLETYPNVNPQSTAYIIMTSGSTGLPKGVEISHYSAWNTIDDINKKYQINEYDSVLCVSAMDFDLSVYDVFGLLGVGGKLVVISDEERKNPDYWIKAINNYKITIWNSVPILLEMLLIVANVYKLKNLSLRVVLLSGDWIPMDLPKKLFALVDECKLVGLGGATEASIWSNYQDVTHPIPTSWKSIPYGRPLSGQVYRVVDKDGRDCPYWVAGELLIGGHGVAKGYRGDMELTNRKFIQENNIRWYRTGDMGRIWSDDTIEFLGRKDYQVKVRGHRIELGEIEAAINQMNEISDCVVSAVENYNNKKTLIGVVIAKKGSVSESDVKKTLEKKIPDYMIPTRILFAEKLPITSNGKRNRKEIVKWIKGQLQEKSVEEESVSYEEIMLLEIWKKLFNHESISIYDNYFELGGDSLLGTRMIAKIKEKMNCNISLKHVFEYNTIKELANKIKEMNSQLDRNSEEFKIVHHEVGRYEAFPTTEIQYAYWVGRKNIYSLGNVSAYCYYEIECNNLDIKRLNRAWNALINKHDSLRLVFSNDGRSQKALEKVPEYEFETYDLTLMSDEDQRIHILQTREEMAQQILDASKWPLFDIRVSQCDCDKQMIHVGIDTLIMDARSVLYVLHEWTKLYNARVSDYKRATEITFRDYVCALSNIKESIPYKRDKQYWLKKLNKFPLYPMIPLKSKPEAITNQKIKRIGKRIDDLKWSKIKENAKSCKLTPSLVLMGVYALILKEFSGDGYFSLNITFDKRMVFNESLEEVVGDFTSTLLLEINLMKSEGFVEFAKRLQNQLTQDMNHSNFTGIDFQRELVKNRGQQFKYGVPIVFTSTLGMKNDTQNIFGKVSYNITQTPQVWIDFQIQEIGKALYLNIDYVEGLVEDHVIEDMIECYCNYLETFIEDNNFIVSNGDDYQEGLI